MERLRYLEAPSGISMVHAAASLSNYRDTRVAVTLKHPFSLWISASGYTVLQSTTGAALSRVLLAIKNDLTYMEPTTPPDETNEYVAVTVKAVYPFGRIYSTSCGI